MRLFIGIAYYDSMKMPTVISLLGTVQALECPYTVSVQRGPYTHWNRERLMQRAYDEDATHLLFLDADMAFPSDGVNRLIAHGVDIVGGNYPMKTTPPRSTVKIMGDDGKLFEGQMPSDPFKCHAVPTGFMLIDLEAARRISQPWFFFTHLENGDIEGEDVWFCRKANEAGLEVWCDPTIPLEHVGDYHYSNGR